MTRGFWEGLADLGENQGRLGDVPSLFFRLSWAQVTINNALRTAAVPLDSVLREFEADADIPVVNVIGRIVECATAITPESIRV